MDEMIIFDQGTALLNPQISSQLAEFERLAKEIKTKEDELKKRILEEMESKGIIKIDTDDLTITYVAPTTREIFDKDRFQDEFPDLYDEYVKIGKVSASVRLKVKGDKQ